MWMLGEVKITETSGMPGEGINAETTEHLCWWCDGRLQYEEHYCEVTVGSVPDFEAYHHYYCDACRVVRTATFLVMRYRSGPKSLTIGRIRAAHERALHDLRALAIGGIVNAHGARSRIAKHRLTRMSNVAT
jgi:hypothetical protein